jgi:hypothetical protein
VISEADNNALQARQLATASQTPRKTTEAKRVPRIDGRKRVSSAEREHRTQVDSGSVHSGRFDLDEDVRMKEAGHSEQRAAGWMFADCRRGPSAAAAAKNAWISVV